LEKRSLNTSVSRIEKLLKELPDGKTISIVGMNKNVGKTTFMNVFLEQIAKVKKKFLIMSIGRDGEKEDVLEKTPKPMIMLPAGNLAVTSDKMTEFDSFIEVIDSYSNTAGGKLFLGRAMENTYVQLLNPGSIAKMKEISSYSLESDLCSLVIIDGALNRSSHSSSALCDYIVMITGAEVHGTVDEIAQKTIYEIKKYETPECEFFIKKLMLDEISQNKKSVLMRNNVIIKKTEKSFIENVSIIEEIEDGDTVFNSGAITDKIVEKLLNTCKKFILIVRDGSVLHLNNRNYRRLMRNGIVIKTLNKVNVIAIAVNGNGIRRSINSSDLIRILEKELEEKPVVDVLAL